MMSLPQTTHDTSHVLDATVGALKLQALHIRHPHTVDASQAMAVCSDALEQLRLIDRAALQLAEAYRCARAAVPAPLLVAVAPYGPDNHLIALVLDGDYLMRSAIAKTPAALAELLRMKVEQPA